MSGFLAKKANWGHLKMQQQKKKKERSWSILHGEMGIRTPAARFLRYCLHPYAMLLKTENF